MQNLGFVYELYVFNTYKVLGIIFKAHDFFIDCPKISFVIFSYHLPFALQKERLKTKDKDKDFDLMNVLLAFKNLKIIWK